VAFDEDQIAPLLPVMFTVPVPWVRVLVSALELLKATAVRLKLLISNSPAVSIAVPEVEAVSSMVVLSCSVKKPFGQFTVNWLSLSTTPAVSSILLTPWPKKLKLGEVTPVVVKVEHSFRSL
jgi:hypothetical protein